jgi:hypothetical protein
MGRIIFRITFLGSEALKRDFGFARNNHPAVNPQILIAEMIAWGDSQGGVAEKFDRGLGKISLVDTFQQIIAGLGNPAEALGCALGIPGLGLTYASKILRFLDPEHYGAIDSRIRRMLPDLEMDNVIGPIMAGMPVIYDGNMHSMINGYVQWLHRLSNLRIAVNNAGIQCPAQNPWRIADIEMAVFAACAE